MDAHKARLEHLKNCGFFPNFIIDIGAHTGNWTLTCRELFPSADFFLVEANPDNETELRELNLPFSITLLGNQENRPTDYFSRNHLTTGNSIFREQTHFYSENQCEIKKLTMRTLDSLLMEKKFSEKNIDLLKLDVQGSEINILRGAVKTIKRVKLLLLETQIIEYNLGAPLIADIFDYMTLINFQMIDLFQVLYLPSGHLFQLDLLFAPAGSPFIKKGLLY